MSIRIVHVLPGTSAHWTGILSSVTAMVEASIAAGIDAAIIAVDDRLDHSAKLPDYFFTVPDDTVGPIRFSHNIAEALDRFRSIDVLHSHGMWQHYAHAAAAQARRRDIPYFVSPHGMLNPAAMSRKALRKRLGWMLWQRSDLMSATACHVMSTSEADHVKGLGYKGNIALLPPPISVPQQLPAKAHEGKALTIGFLGRIDPDKGIATAIGALARPSCPADVTLEIAGSGSEAYISQLQSLASRLGVADRVRFVGHLTGTAKWEALARWDLLVLPSRYESFAMSIAEALAAGTPVLASSATPWEALDTHRAGRWRIDTPDHIADAIANYQSLTADERADMSSSARALAATFAPSRIGAELHNLYTSLINNAKRHR